MSQNGNQKFVLYNRKAERLPPTNWNYVPIPAERLDKLRVGDVVRLLLEHPKGSGWEKIYFAISKVTFYSKGSVTRPKKFYGVALPTYRVGSQEYVSDGEVITFQRSNIVEVPGWVETDLVVSQRVPPQNNVEIFEAERERQQAWERREEEREWKKKQEKKKKKKEDY